MRILSIATVVLTLALSFAGPADAQSNRPGIFNKLFGRERSKPRPAATGVVGRLEAKLSAAKTERQQAARLGTDPAELRRMDARIDGLEQMRDLVAKRVDLARKGRPRIELDTLDARIVAVRQALRQLAAESVARGHKKPARKNTDLWITPRGLRAEQAYEAGSLRRSMGI